MKSVHSFFLIVTTVENYLCEDDRDEEKRELNDIVNHPDEYFTSKMNRTFFQTKLTDLGIPLVEDRTRIFK